MKSLLFVLALLVILPACTPATADRTIDQHDLIYFVLTDRFFDGDAANNEQVNKHDPRKYHGGDFKGLQQKLDYIQELGATAVWITPVQDNTPDGYHGYWIDDFFKIEPSLGTMDDLKALSRDIHKRNMKLIVDFVANHTGYDSTLLKQHPDWFHEDITILNYNDQQQVQNGWLAGLPDFDQSKPEVQKYLIDAALWLIKEADIDGFRLDTVRHIDPSFWKTFTEAIRKEHPDFYFVGEVFDFNASVVKYWKQTGIEGMLDYPMYKAMRETFRDSGSATTLAKAIETARKDEQRHLNGLFIDNHDNKRFLSTMDEHGPDYLKQAITFMMTYDAIPVMYYGTEVLMEGGDDPDNRRDFPWDQADNRLQPLWQTLLDIRHDPQFQNGTFEMISADQDVLIYRIKGQRHDYLVLMNVREHAITQALPAEVLNGRTKAKSLLSERILNGQSTEWTLEPFAIEIFKAE